MRWLSIELQGAGIVARFNDGVALPVKTHYRYKYCTRINLNSERVNLHAMTMMADGVLLRLAIDGLYCIVLYISRKSKGIIFEYFAVFVICKMSKNKILNNCKRFNFPPFKKSWIHA